MLSELGTTWNVLYPEQFHPFIWQGYWSTLHYFHGSKRDMEAYVFEGFALILLELRTFACLSVLRQAFRGYKIEVKTPIIKDLNLVRRRD